MASVDVFEGADGWDADGFPLACPTQSHPARACTHSPHSCGNRGFARRLAFATMIRWTIPSRRLAFGTGARQFPVMGRSMAKSTGRSPGAECRGRSPLPKGKADGGEPDGVADETIPPPGKTKARAKSGPRRGAAAKPGSGKPRSGKNRGQAGKTKPSREGKSAQGKPAQGKKVRLAPRKAFLIAATLARDGDAPNLRVYAAVVRSAEAALAAVRGEVGDEAAVELTGSLSTRMAKTLGLRPDEIRQI